jgi:hypothetical protein
MQITIAKQIRFSLQTLVFFFFLIASSTVCFSQYSFDQSPFYRIPPSIEGYMTTSPPPYEFRVGFDPFDWRLTMDHAGKGELVNSKSKETRTFRVPLEKDEWIEKLYYCFYKGDFIFLYEVTSGPEGAARIVRMDHQTLKEKWGKKIPAFNLGPPLKVDNKAFVTGIGFVGQLNLDNGDYDWMHDKLYSSGGTQDSFNSFEEPFIIKSVIVFPESHHSLFNRWPIYLLVDLKSGNIIKNEQIRIKTFLDN